ncbi:hypothetical protein FO519_005034 [Halicephalobus sp. NKZ332]|nr:hypothetical protein FO519_005034 [Halicephalobus sp. NKZ332]
MSDHEINSIESDEERVTVIPSHRRSQSRLSEGTRYSQIPRELCTSPTTTVPIHSVVNESGVTSIQKIETSKEEERFLSIVEVNGRLMKFDTSPLKNEEGCFKIIEIILILIALCLSGMVMGVSGERGFAMLVCFFAFMLIFGIILAKVLTLNQMMSPKQWSLIELSIYIGLGVAFFIATLLMALLCTLHWIENNPAWQTVPAFASLALALCGVAFFAEACLVFYNRRYRSWSPQNQKTMI